MVRLCRCSQLLLLVCLTVTSALPAPPGKKAIRRSTSAQESLSPKHTRAAQTNNPTLPNIASAKLLGQSRFRVDADGERIITAASNSRSNAKNLLPRIVTAASNSRSSAKNLLPRVDDILPVSQVNNDEFVLLELLQPERGSPSSQTLNRAKLQQDDVYDVELEVNHNNFNQQLSNNNFNQQLSNNNFDQLSIDNLNQFSNDDFDQLSNDLDISSGFSDQISKGTLLANTRSGIPIPVPSSRSQNSNFGRFSNSAATNQGSQFGAQLPSFSSNTPVGRPLPPIELGQSVSADANNQLAGDSITVGDLLKTLNGQNGINVVSLGDLVDNERETIDIDDELLLQLRNAMISGNLDQFSDFPIGSAGASLSSLVEQNIDGTGAILNAEDELNAGRQFDATLDGTADTGADSGPIDTQITDAGSAATDPLASDYTDPFALDDFADTGDYDYEPLPAQPPNVFRTKMSDMFFTKGQWIGTLFGGLVDVGLAIGNKFTKSSGDSDDSTDS